MTGQIGDKAECPKVPGTPLETAKNLKKNTSPQT
jgi:hypothetical protein